MRAADSELNLSISRLVESADDSVQGLKMSLCPLLTRR